MKTEYKNTRSGYVDTKEYTKIPFEDIQILDDEPVEVMNPFSQVKVMLTPTEVAVYDVTMGSYHMGLYKEFYKGRDWFIDNNPEAYFDLID